MCKLVLFTNRKWYGLSIGTKISGLSVRRRQKKHRLVVEVESLASSSKKYTKSRRTLNKNSCHLSTTITYIKIPVAYLISYKN